MVRGRGPVLDYPLQTGNFRVSCCDRNFEKRTEKKIKGEGLWPAGYATGFGKGTI
jgi:hypothetical protein